MAGKFSNCMQQTALVFVYIENPENMRAEDKVAAELFRRYSKRLYSTALHITLCSDEAEEIMQETLIRFITDKDALANRNADSPAVWSWLRNTCVRLSIDFLRRRTRFVSLDAAEGDISGIVSEEHDDEELWAHLDGQAMPMVMKSLAELPDGYRTILTLRLLEEYDYHEISLMLGIGEASVRSQYMRGRKKLAVALKRMMNI